MDSIRYPHLFEEPGLSVANRRRCRQRVKDEFPDVHAFALDHERDIRPGEGEEPDYWAY